MMLDSHGSISEAGSDDECIKVPPIIYGYSYGHSESDSDSDGSISEAGSDNECVKVPPLIYGYSYGHSESDSDRDLSDSGRDSDSGDDELPPFFAVDSSSEDSTIGDSTESDDGRYTSIWNDSVEEEGSTERNELNKLTVKVLKERLKEKDLPSSGLKSSLIDRLLGKKRVALQGEKEEHSVFINL